ncbi:nanos homolog 3 [Rhipicephalus microplus]|uniref:nanos homolog 3 n=1 Tax=Rhipicephalus microplus TaxID=6941 RepID=UPI003F6BB6A6
MASGSSLRPSSQKPFDGCAFCRTNGERRPFYMSHALREDSGPRFKGRVTCPVLRSYQCPQCGCPGGDEAHTLRYCPLNEEIAPSVYKTPRKSNGQLRRSPRAAEGSRCLDCQGTPSPRVAGRWAEPRKPSKSRVCPVGPPLWQSFWRRKVAGPRFAVKFQRW